MTTIPRQLVQPGATSKQVGDALGRLIATARKNSINANQHEMKTDKELGVMASPRIGGGEGVSTPAHKPSPFPWREGKDGNDIVDANGDLVTVTCEEITVSDYDRILACVNAMAGMDDPQKEIREMVEHCKKMTEAIKGADYALRKSLKYIMGIPAIGSDMECEAMDDAHQALAKLKPFVK